MKCICLTKRSAFTVKGKGILMRDKSSCSPVLLIAQHLPGKKVKAKRLSTHGLSGPSLQRLDLEVTLRFGLQPVGSEDIWTDWTDGRAGGRAAV